MTPCFEDFLVWYQGVRLIKYTLSIQPHRPDPMKQTDLIQSDSSRPIIRPICLCARVITYNTFLSMLLTHDSTH